MDHYIKFTLVLPLLLHFSCPPSGEPVLPLQQVQKIAAVDLDNGINQVNLQGRKVKAASAIHSKRVKR